MVNEGTDNRADGTDTDLFRWLDSLKFSRFHVSLVLMTGLSIFFAGYCTQIEAFVLPSLLKDWGLPPVKAGALVSWGFLGIMLGALFFGPIADRAGRKKTLLVALALCSLATGLSCFAPGFTTFCLLRFCTGLGIGGVFPLSITLVAEVAPSGIRARLLTVAVGGFTLGWVAAALVSMALIPAFGWRIVLAAGALPLLFLPLLWLYLPESVRFLCGRMDQIKLNNEVNRIGRITDTPPPALPERASAMLSRPGSGRLSNLFRSGLARMTILLSLTYLFSTLALYGISSWLPSLLVKAGFSLAKSFSYSMVQAIGSCVGGCSPRLPPRCLWA